MPIRTCTLPGGGSGFKWGHYGKCYESMEDAKRQGRAAYANGYAGDEIGSVDRHGLIRFALDLQSVRSFDDDGHLHVADSPISKAAVNPYYGSEIPDYERLGLDPERVYRLLRHPDELAAAATSFAGKPIMVVHRGSIAEDHPRSLTVGAVGSPVRWVPPYLRAPLHIWDGEAIGNIANNKQRQLSCGYRYDADMRPGTWQGQPFDGVMRNIRGNHVALVQEGRAGPDVWVGDSALPSRVFIITKGNDMAKVSQAVAPSRTALMLSGALRAFLVPRMAADQKIDIAPLAKGVTGKNWPQRKPAIITAVTALAKDKLAKDADLEGLPEVLETLDQPAAEEAKEKPPASAAVPMTGTRPNGAAEDDEGSDVTEQVRALLEGKLQPEDLQAVLDLLGHEVSEAGMTTDEPPPFPGQPKKDEGGSMITKRAMDAALDKARQDTQAEMFARMAAIREAERLVRPVTGELAMDAKSADEVYKFALDHMKIPVGEDVPASAYKAIFVASHAAEERAKATIAAAQPAGGRGFSDMAEDEASVADIRKRFPGFHLRSA